MRRLVEVEGAGLEALLGESVLLLCLNYFYTGKLVGVNDDFVMLNDARIVYDTGGFSTKDYTTAEELPEGVWYVKQTAIESFGKNK